MRGLQKSKRVSWASDLNLCQVKLFLSDESPSQVGSGGQDHLQAKDSWSWQAAGSDDNLPPGFEGIQPANSLQNKLSQIPIIQWKCPSRFVLDPTWQVAAGEESKEAEVESQREMRVLEAVYPRPSAVPPNPASTLGADESSHYNDQHTPVIPVTPIEDEDPPLAPSSSSSSIPPLAATNGIVPGVEPDVITAAYSALSAAMSNTNQGNLIDPNLLLKLLSDPGLVEKLVSTHAPSPSIQPIAQLPPVPATLPPPVSAPDPPIPVTTHLLFSTPPSYPPPSRPIPVPEANPSAKKDINYYKSLIQQHGGDKPETNNQKTRDTKGKIMKPCIYFNGPRGCRNGATCVFQHDSSSSSSQQRVNNNNLQETQSAKRMKMDSREITFTGT